MTQKEAIHILTILRNRGIEAYIVGGIAKDILTGQHSTHKDIDILVLPEQTNQTIRILKKLGYKEDRKVRVDEQTKPNGWRYGSRKFFVKGPFGVDLFSNTKTQGCTVPNKGINSQVM